MKKMTKLWSFLLMFTILFSQAGCTKEKAEALKTTAKAFQAQADVAVDNLEKLFIADVAFTPEAKEEIVARTMTDLQVNPFGRRQLETIVDGVKLKELDTSAYSQKLASIRTTYSEFAAMYENLPRGSYFAGDAVERSEKMAIKLTAQMLSLGKFIKAHPFKLNARLQEVRRKRNEAMKETNAAVRELKLRAVAEDIINLKNETDAANNLAIAECTKGAAIGLEVAKLTRQYKKLSVQDVLQIMKEVLPAISQLTGKNTDDLMGRLGNIQLAIDNDPVWQDIATRVEAEINAVPAIQAVD